MELQTLERPTDEITQSREMQTKIDDKILIDSISLNEIRCAILDCDGSCTAWFNTDTGDGGGICQAGLVEDCWWPHDEA